MLLWFKKKKVIVDCFTTTSGIYQYAPIESYKKYYPQYWKDLPSKNKIVNNNGLELEEETLKVCNAFLDLYQNAFTIPLWADLKLKVQNNTNFSWQWSHGGLTNDLDGLVNHLPHQYGDAFKNFTHIKIGSPWLIREKRGIKFHWSEPTWNMVNTFGNDIRVLPGIVKYNSSFTTHINLLIRSDIGETMIPYKTPMTVVIPLSEDKIEIKNHLIDEKEFKKIADINYYNPTFTQSYRNRSKCPFTGNINFLLKK